MFSSLRNFHPLRVAASVGLKSTLPKVLVGAALLGGGASLLSAGNAQAVQVFCGGPSETVGDKTISNIICSGGNPLLVGNGPPVPNPDNVFLFFDQAGITYDFASTFSPLQTGPGSISYTLTINPLNLFFDRVELDSECDDVAGGACNVQKTFAGLTLNSVNGEETFANIGSLNLRTLNVVDSWAPTAPGALRGVENAYTQTTHTVPGPLPLLGAGMAFGFSRRLRSRIKARAQA